MRTDGAVNLDAERHWVCPNCPATAVTKGSETNRFHPCPGLRGVLAPMVLEGDRVWVQVVEREDYVNGELVQTDAEGRPVAAVTTLRADGSNDLAILAPTARGFITAASPQ